MTDYSLRAYQPIAQGGGFIADITANAAGWKREVTFTGGAWHGTFTLTGDKQYLEDWFYNGLARHIEERTGGFKTWVGLVWEMNYLTSDKTNSTRLGTRGRRERRTLETMYNAVKVSYTDPTDNSTGTSSWQTDNVSIGIYGRKELILFEEVEATNAANIAETILAESSGAEPEFIGLEQNVTEDKLEITVVGYSATAQYLYTDTADGSSSTVSDWIEEMLDELEFITPIKVEANDTAIEKTLTEPTRIWAQIEQLMYLKDSSDNVFNITIDSERQAVYKSFDNEPIGLFWNGLFVSRAYENLEATARHIKPGIYRDAKRYMKYSASVMSDSSFLQSVADFLVEGFEVDMNNTITPRLRNEDDEEKYRTWNPGEPAGTGDGWTPPEGWEQIGNITEKHGVKSTWGSGSYKEH